MTFVTKAVVLACLVLTVACGQPEPPPSGTSAEPAAAAAPADPYRADVMKFRDDRENQLESDAGWLTIGGLFFLSQPKMTFGSDPLSDIVFPETAPAHAGVFEVRNGRVYVTPADGVSFVLNGKPFTSGEIAPDSPGPADRLSLGQDLQFWVHKTGDRLSIRLRDQNNDLRKTFTGLSWFPIDPAYRVEATYTAYDKPKVVDVPTIAGDIDTAPIPGIVSFVLHGQEYKLEPFAEPDDEELWFVFRDLTSQDETYPAARFLYAARPVDGKTILDFNKAENPPCAYNPYTTCPLPSEQNRLKTRIEAGERYVRRK